jgi:hypothetical protein
MVFHKKGRDVAVFRNSTDHDCACEFVCVFFFCFVNEKLKSINIELGKHSTFDIFLMVDLKKKKKRHLH